MKRNLFRAIWTMMILCFIATLNIYATQRLSLDINGESSKIKPIVVNGSAMLPLRDTLNILGCDDILWDQKTSTVTVISGNMRMKLKPEKDSADVEFGFGKKSEWLLTRPPVIRNGKAYLPLRFISDVFFSEIKYENKTVFLNTPFKYTANNWYRTNRFTWQEVFVNSSTTMKKDDTIYLMLTTQRESLYVEPGTLFALASTGEYKLLCWMPALVSRYDVADNQVYYQYNTSVLGGYDVIEKINLSDINETARFGREDFSYGSKIVPGDKIDLGNGIHAFDFKRETGNWEVKPEGVYAVGFARNAVADGLMNNLSLFKETYGYYLLQENGNHKLIKKL